MGIIVLVIIGFVIWKICGSHTYVESKEDKEFEDACMSLKDVDDDFDMF